MEIQTQRTCNSLESEQRFNRPSRHQRRSQSPVVKIIHLERLVFSKHKCKNMSRRSFQLRTTPDLNVGWVWTKSKTGLLPSGRCVWSKCKNMVLTMCVTGENCRWRETSDHKLFWDQSKTQSRLSIWGECQAAWVNSSPLVWGVTPCPLTHKSLGPQVLYCWSPKGRP